MEIRGEGEEPGDVRTKKNRHHSSRARNSLTDHQRNKLDGASQFPCLEPASLVLTKSTAPLNISPRKLRPPSCVPPPCVVRDGTENLEVTIQGEAPTKSGNQRLSTVQERTSPKFSPVPPIDHLQNLDFQDPTANAILSQLIDYLDRNTSGPSGPRSNSPRSQLSPEVHNVKTYRPVVTSAPPPNTPVSTYFGALDDISGRSSAPRAVFFQPSVAAPQRNSAPPACVGLGILNVEVPQVKVTRQAPHPPLSEAGRRPFSTQPPRMDQEQYVHDLFVELRTPLERHESKMGASARKDKENVGVSAKEGLDRAKSWAHTESGEGGNEAGRRQRSALRERRVQIALAERTVERGNSMDRRRSKLRRKNLARMY